MTELIKEIIQRDKLDSPERHATLNNKRMYLYTFMRKQGMSYHNIAKEFNRTHATVINGLNRYKDLIKSNDAMIKVDTEEYEQIFASIPAPKPVYNLAKDVRKATTIHDLDIIKRRLKNNMYDIDLH
jgi:IS30 family transposase